MVLPESFILPPYYYLVPLIIVFAGTIALLWALKPPVTDKTVLAFVPWIVLGSTLHVLYQVDAIPESIAPLFSSPSVYITTASIAGLVWILGTFLFAAGLQRSIEHFIVLIGTAIVSVFIIATLYHGWLEGNFNPLWPAIAIITSGLVTAIVWIALSLTYTEIAASTSITGFIVIFSHAFDGISTAIGYDHLGAGEEVPASRAILEFSASLPTADLLGAGWLFIVVKIALALIIVALFAEYVREAPRRARIFLGLIAAVGLGPAVHNVLLFTIT